MIVYETAVGAGDEAERERVREWLLAYNRGDVEATCVLLAWLSKIGVQIRGVDEV